MAKKRKKNIATGKRKKKRQAQQERQAKEEQMFLETADEKALKERAKQEKKEAEQKKKEIAQKKKQKEREEHPSFWRRSADYLKSTWVELKKTQWLTPSQLNKATGSVFGIVSIFTAMTWIVDSGLGSAAAFLLRLK